MSEGNQEGNVHLSSLSAERSHTVRNEMAMDFEGLNLIAKSQINLKECVHKTQGKCFGSLSLRSWFILKRTHHLLKGSLMSGSARVLVLTHSFSCPGGSVTH